MVYACGHVAKVNNRYKFYRGCEMKMNKYNWLTDRLLNEILDPEVYGKKFGGKIINIIRDNYSSGDNLSAYPEGLTVDNPYVDGNGLEYYDPVNIWTGNNEAVVLANVGDSYMLFYWADTRPRVKEIIFIEQDIQDMQGYKCAGVLEFHLSDGRVIENFAERILPCKGKS